MKTYLLDALNRYKRFSKTLDVKAVLCNKSWQIFNDTGEKEVYIFQEDGSLIVSCDGKVRYVAWQFIPANQSLIINAGEESYMLHPAFIDEKIFALQQDGTNKFVFMIDEKQSDAFMPKSLLELAFYFEQQEHKKTQEERKLQQHNAEQEREQQIKWKRKEAEMAWERDRETILKDDVRYRKYKKIYWVLSIAISIIPVGCVAFSNWPFFDSLPIIILFIFLFVSFLSLVWIILNPIIKKILYKFSYFRFDESERKEQYINEYIKQRNK